MKNTAEEYANIAFKIPDEFSKRYSNMSADQCAAFVDIKNANGRTYFEWLACDYPVTPSEILYILRNLNSEKLFAVCQLRDANRKTLLHRIAERSSAYKPVTEYIMQALTDDELITLYSKLDKHNKTILHYLFDAFELKKVKALFELPKFKALLNNLAMIQDHEGATFLTRASMAGLTRADYLEFFIDNLSDETLDNLMMLPDNKGNHFLYYFIRNVASDTALKKMHEKLLAMQTKRNSIKYYQAIIALIRNPATVQSVPYEKVKIIGMGLKILNEVIAAKKFPINDLLAIRQETGTPLILEAFLNFDTGITPTISVLAESQEYKAQATQLWADLHGLIYKLFNKVPARRLLNTLEQFRARNSFLNVTRSLLYRSLITSFVNHDLLPCAESDPLKVFKFFDITTIEDKSRFTHETLNFPIHTRSYQAESFLFQPESSVLLKPKEFCAFYQNIFNFQVSPGNKHNAEYLTIIAKAIAAILNRDKIKYPDTDKLYTAAQMQLENMSTLLTKRITPEAVMKMRMQNMSALQLSQAAEFCNLAIESVADQTSLKLILELKLFQFMHAAAKKYLETSTPVKAPLQTSVPDEKAEIILSLDDDHAESMLSLESKEERHILSDDASRAIHLFNCRIVPALDLDTDDVSSDQIDEVSYAKLQKSHLNAIKALHKKNWQAHLSAFSTYIESRALARPYLFSNSKDDYLLRKAYYDAITVKDNDINDIYKKLAVIESAINDPRIYKGFSHRCLDLLKLLKKDFETWIFLLETKSDPATELQIEMSSIAEDNRYVI